MRPSTRVMAALALPKIGGLIEEALLEFDGKRYALVAWCVMPNHVHALIETRQGYALDRVVHSWKSFTAHAANKVLNRSGAFWAPDYFDRYIRDEAHLASTMEYIEFNPVRARLCREPSEWPFSSAARR